MAKKPGQSKHSHKEEQPDKKKKKLVKPKPKSMEEFHSAFKKEAN